MTDKFNLIIAGGKTGGHLFPGIAVAQALKAEYPNAKILFVGTDAPFEVSTLKTYGFDHKTIVSRPIKGGSPLSKLFSSALILVSLVQALGILTRFKADYVLGVGGFSSFALVLAAWILRIPRAIQEQNSIPGITNRMLSRFADSIFTAFETTKGMSSSPKTKCVGNPIRRTTPKELQEGPMDIHPDDFVILVTGGSQGAASINRAFVQAIKSMDNLDQVYIIHQTGIADETAIKQAYGQIKVRGTVQAFFQNMPALQEKACLAITRAGASTVSELTIKGLPAILVPFPHAADDHQTFNAKILEEKGAAILIADKDLTGSVLKDTLQTLLADRKKLKQMGLAAKNLAMPDADKIIATIILNTKNLGV
ncbi:MAG: undecaprenyldiphospho-muramoylpentapeptide beta-N-acetylglucosaminyltransferase [Proteobacteria bacterium]|nr:undecaprenyldiphospho-muramoylpentapeptide beta-N-acetylglucosaminyltransferase [Desulfobacula sp.]MBU4133131.1 undecaprenyldiphospho-muramoylpentapeptide beta-N-acetylglucosaminyltransferase [Pseudomonadota bacterium]